MKKIKKAGGKRGIINTVKSGIGLNELSVGKGDAASAPEHAQESQSAITSRTARVLLAGAGFLADAVSFYSHCVYP